MKTKTILTALLISFLLITLLVLVEGNTQTMVVSYDSGDDWHYSLAVYDGKLYSGALHPIDSERTGRVYAFDGTAWSNSFETLDEPVIWSLGTYAGKLYAGTGSTATIRPPARIYVYDGISWSLAYEPDTNYEASCIFALAEYDGELYAGVGYPWGPGRVYNFDGTSWSISLETSYPEVYMRSLCVYDGKLYLGTEPEGNIYVFDGNNWEISYATGQYSIYSLAVYNGELYAGTSPDGIIYVFDGTSWSISYDSTETGIPSLAVYNTKLYAGTRTGGLIYVYDGITWDLAYDSPQSSILSLADYNNHLYAGSQAGIIYVTSLAPISVETTLPPGLPYTVTKTVFTGESSYSMVTPQVEAGFEGWVTFIPDSYNNVPPGSSLAFEETIIVPDGTAPGDYTFTVDVVGDEEILGTQTITIHVLTSPGYIDQKIEELADLIEASNSPQGTKRSLLAKLGTVVLKKEKGNYLPAANQMEAFINELLAQYEAERVSYTDYPNWWSRALHIQSELLNLVSS